MKTRFFIFMLSVLSSSWALAGAEFEKLDVQYLIPASTNAYLIFKPNKILDLVQNESIKLESGRQSCEIRPLEGRTLFNTDEIPELKLTYMDYIRDESFSKAVMGTHVFHARAPYQPPLRITCSVNLSKKQMISIGQFREMMGQYFDLVYRKQTPEEGQ